MESPKHRITFKVLTGYIILGVLATISGVLVVSEIKTFTEIQKKEIFDRSKIVKVGSLIASIYENESLSRAALQLNSSKKIKQYADENEQLLLKIDSLNIIVDNNFQKTLLDSVKIIIDQKLKNIIGLKKVKRTNNSDASIHTAINKLTSIDSILGKRSIADFEKDSVFFNQKRPTSFEDYIRVLNGLDPKNVDINMNQSQIDSLLNISKNKLKEAQKEIYWQRRSLERKERELVENDILISKKLRELLNTLERDIVEHSKTINIQREKSLNRSKNIILFAAGISFVIIVIFSIIFLNDFWKSERYRKKLEKANKVASSLLKSREQIISMVSHDLRTPLSTITGYSELLQKSISTTKDSNYVDHIQSASKYMGQLVDDLLEFSNIEKNKISITSVPFDLHKLMDEVMKHSEDLVEEKPIKFILDFDHNINNALISDPFRIKQILYNLVMNAYKFTDEGTITVKSVLNKEKNILELSVKDTGIGIDKTHQKNIFRAFTQGENAKSNKQNGFGLGLTISKKISQLLGGDLKLDSELGKGSTFTLTVPVTLTDKVIEKKVKPQMLFDIKVLVVEDDVSMRQLLSDLLKQYGITPYVFENAQKALEAINDIHFDMVLTDIQLPKMNGIHFMEVLKTQSTYSNQPIIAMTGRVNLTIKDYIESGFSDVLIKPFDTDKLESILHHFFDADISKTEITTSEINNPEAFNLNSLSAFLNNDEEAIKNTLTIFFKDTINNKAILNKAKEKNDIDTINHITHKMLSMFNQLEVQSIIPFLQMLETAEQIDLPVFNAFEEKLELFIKSLEKYLNQDIN